MSRSLPAGKENEQKLVSFVYESKKKRRCGNVGVFSVTRTGIDYPKRCCRRPADAGLWQADGVDFLLMSKKRDWHTLGSFLVNDFTWDTNTMPQSAVSFMEGDDSAGTGVYKCKDDLSPKRFFVPDNKLQ